MKRVVCTKLDIYVFIFYYILELIWKSAVTEVKTEN